MRILVKYDLLSDLNAGDTFLCMGVSTHTDCVYIKTSVVHNDGKCLCINLTDGSSLELYDETWVRKIDGQFVELEV